MQVTHLTTWTTTFVCLLITSSSLSILQILRHGRACISIRENEIAADAMGINTTYYKVLAFAIGAFFADGVQGHCMHIIFISFSQ